MPPLWALVFSAAQLMSVANILRTREKYKRLRLYVRAFGSIWRYGTTSGCKLEGRLTCLGADMQQPTACRKDEGTRVRRVWLRSSSQTESRTCPREKQPSSGSQDWIVTRAGVDRKEADWSAARDCENTPQSLERFGRRMCALSGDAGVPARGTMEEST